MRVIVLLLLNFIIYWGTTNAQILSEDFEGGAVPPPGWIIFDSLDAGGNPIGSYNWANSTISNSGSNAAFIRWENTPSISTNFLVTPQVIPTVGNSTLSFFQREQILASYGTVYQVRISTASQNTVSDFSTIVASYTESDLTTSYAQFSVDLSAYIGTPIYIAFVHIQDNGDSWYIDDVVLGVPPCNAPSALSVNNVTTTTADLSWTAGSGAETEVVILPAGSPVPTNNIIGNTTTANPFTATGLTPATGYDAYIRDVCATSAPLVISGIYDMPLSGGTPKGVELYVVEDIADLSAFGLGTANNGGGTDGVEFTFPAVPVSAGTRLYISSDSANFHSYFGFAPSYTSSVMDINGNDAIELFQNTTVVDVFGDINVDGTGQPWEYLDGWAYRNLSQLSNNGTFNVANWTFSGINAVDGCTSNASCASSMPIGTFVTSVQVSPFVGPINFTTACAAITPMYSTNFANYLPSCWEEATNGTLVTGPTGPGASSWGKNGNAARINLYGTNRSDWLLTPEFDLSSGSWELVLNMNGANYSPSSGSFSGMGSDDSVQVVISTDNGMTWTEIYSFNTANPIGGTATDYVVDLSAYTGSSNLFGIRASDGTVNDVEDYYIYLNNFQIRTPPSCSAPTTLNTSNVTGTTADLNWTTTAGTVEIEWGAQGFTQGTGTVVTTTTAPYNLTGLTQLTSYEFYVRSICGTGDTSTWAGPVVFTTPCAVITPAYSTNFANYLPSCWEEATNGTLLTGPTGVGTSQWGKSGTTARINLYGANRSDWLLTPAFDLSSGSWELVLNIHALDYGTTTGAFSGMGSDDSVQVVISTDGGATWTEIYTFNPSNPLVRVATDYAIDLSAYTGASNLFGIRASDGAVNDVEDYNVIVNNFEIRVPPSCPMPANVVASNVTGTTADLSWTTTAGTVEIEWGVQGFTQGTGTVVTATTAPYNLTGLTELTSYEFYVRSICGAGDTSVWAGPAVFTTPCSVVIPNYTTNFSTYLPACWEEYTDGTLLTGPIGPGASQWGKSGNTARINLYGTNRSDWLVSPTFDLSTGTWELVLNMNGIDYGSSATSFSGMGSDDSVQVAISTDGGATWTAIYSFNAANPIAGMPTNYVIDLSAYTGSSNLFGIRASDKSVNDPEDYYVVVNNFEIRPLGTVTADVAVTSYLNVDAVYCNATAITGSVIITNNDANPISDVPYIITANGLPLATDTIATLGAMMSDTIVVGPVPVTATGPGVITTIVNVMGDINTANDTLTTTVFVSNTRANAAVAADVMCNGGADGSAGTGATGGFAPYTFAWSDGQTTADAIGLMAGMYIVTVTDTVGCSDIDTVTIAEPSAIVLSMASTNASCNGACDGTATATVTGGTAGYTYAWSNGMNTATATGLCATTYMVTVTDANGCTAMDSVVITEPTAVVAATTDNGDGTATATATGGAAPYTFAWDNGDATATTTSALNSGDTYCVTATDANGCTDTACVVVVFSSIEGTNGTASTMRMYPNPTSDNVFVAFDLTSLQTAELQLINMAGQVVWEQSFDAIKDQTITINTAELPSGVYMMHTVVGAERISKKLVIARQ